MKAAAVGGKETGQYIEGGYFLSQELKETSMVPKREQFILDVRRAVRLEQKPIVATDSEMINPDAVSRALQRAALWLTPKTVENYDPAEFTALSQDLQDSLRSAVDAFLAAAKTVPSDKAGTAVQFKDGLAAFERLIGAVRQVVLKEWTEAVEGLIKQVEQWSEDFGWRTRREEKKLTETLLGAYSLPQLQFFTEQHLYVLDPIARFVPEAMGAFDLSIQPSYYLTTLFRDYDGAWQVHLDVGQGVKGKRTEPWSEDSYRRVVEELRTLL
jgi:hypothetical protein